MYYLDEIMNRTFDNWGAMLGANDFSFWAGSTIETKPTTDTTTETLSTPAETPAWEPADTSQWSQEPITTTES
ncbi:hypothetical protein H8D29_02455 [PVC group bacterium]|nr:hypothetical protein [PVC group bacterium]